MLITRRSSSQGSDSDEDDPTAADGDAGDDADGDQDDSLSAHSGATASMSRRESKAGESGKEDDDDDDGDDEDDGDEEMKEVDEQMGALACCTTPCSHAPRLTCGSCCVPLCTGGLVRSASPSHAVAATQARRSPSLPPSLKRRRLFYPAPPSSPPLAARSLHIDPHMSIPIHSPVHSLAATPCLSYVLTGSEDGYVRAWDTWSSANGGSLMTAHQRAVGGLGEGVTKGGVCRGWWENEGPLPPSAGSTSATGLNGVDNDNSERQRAREPVYSLALQRDALWGLSGTAVRPCASFLFFCTPSDLPTFAPTERIHQSVHRPPRDRSDTASARGRPCGSRGWPRACRLRRPRLLGRLGRYRLRASFTLPSKT